MGPITSHLVLLVIQMVMTMWCHPPSDVMGSKGSLELIIWWPFNVMSIRYIMLVIIK